jgi:hypothetical protein
MRHLLEREGSNEILRVSSLRTDECSRPRFPERDVTVRHQLLRIPEIAAQSFRGLARHDAGSLVRDASENSRDD